MQAGRLRHRLTIESPTETRDALGQAVASWTTFAQVWGDFMPLSGRERFLSQQTHAEVTARAVIRYLAGLTEKMRIVFDGDAWEILHIKDDRRSRQLVIDLRAGVLDG